MESLIIGLIIITTIICYTVCKVGCNHVNKYPTGGLKKQPKDGHIDCRPLPIEWVEVYKREVCNK